MKVAALRIVIANHFGIDSDYLIESKLILIYKKHISKIDFNTLVAESERVFEAARTIASEKELEDVRDLIIAELKLNDLSDENKN